jgi:hypothetical protein
MGERAVQKRGWSGCKVKETLVTQGSRYLSIELEVFQ